MLVRWQEASKSPFQLFDLPFAFGCRVGEFHVGM